MNILKFFTSKKHCHHTKVPPQADISYCPDCGELIENKWYICRCACCGIKLKAVIKDGEVIPEEHYCHNCGSEQSVKEEISKINFVDINYAVLVKTVIKPKIDELTQSWLDNFRDIKPKLITQT